MRRDRLLAWGQTCLYALPILYLALFFLYPLAAILRISLAPEGRLDLSPWRALIQDGYYRRVLWFTTWQATASTALTLALGLPAAYAFARYRFPGKEVLRALTTVPFVLPALVVAAAANPTGFPPRPLACGRPNVPFAPSKGGAVSIHARSRAGAHDRPLRAARARGGGRLQ